MRRFFEVFCLFSLGAVALCALLLMIPASPFLLFHYRRKSALDTRASTKRGWARRWFSLRGGST